MVLGEVMGDTEMLPCEGVSAGEGGDCVGAEGRGAGGGEVNLDTSIRGTGAENGTS